MRTALLRLFAALTVAASVSVVFIGCGKSPEAVCKKFEELSKDDKDKEKKGMQEWMKECTEDMTEIKKVSPESYKCTVSCLDLKSFEAAFLCHVACGEKDDKVKEYYKKRSEKREEERAKKMVEWTKLKEKSFEGSLKSGSKEAKYSVSLVEGFSDDKDMKGESLKIYRLEPDKDSGLFVGPSVNISFGYEEDVEKAAESVGMMKNKVVKKEKTDSGYSIQTEGDGTIGVEVMVKKGEVMVECKANIYNQKAPDFKGDLLPWLEKMCKTLKLK